jgi:hypothetical protein
LLCGGSCAIGASENASRSRRWRDTRPQDSRSEGAGDARTLGSLLLIGACTFAEPADVDALDGVTLSIVAGDGQSGTVGTTLGQPIVIGAADQDGNPLPNLTLELAITAGGGSVDSPAITTDVQGNAHTLLTLGTVPGTNTLEARMIGDTDFVSASMTAIVGAPAMVEIEDGDEQSGVAGTSLPQPLVVRVADQYSNPVPEIVVEFTITEGNGSTSNVTTTSDASGLAETSLVLDTKAGANGVAAFVVDLEPVEFTATGIAGAPAQLRKTSGEGQSAAGGTLLTAPLEVTVEDAHGNPTEGIVVNFTADRGSVTTSSASTGADGTAATTFRLSNSTGINRITAAVEGLPSVEFLASAVSATAASITKVSGDNQSGTVNRTLTAQLVVIARDQNLAPVEGFLVTFVTTTNNGAPTTATVPTDANGQARTFFRLGTVAGTNSVQPRGGTIVGASFAATGTADVPTKVVVPSIPTLVDAFAAPTTLSAITTDAFNNPVSGRTITWAVVSGNASVSPTSGVSNPIVNTAVTVGTLADVVLEARSSGLTTAVVSLNVHGFRPHTDHVTTVQGTGLRIVELNGDGKPDVVVFAGEALAFGGLEMFANTTPTTSAIATLGPRSTALPNSTVRSAISGDFNADGKQDLVVERRNAGVAACTTSCLTLLVNTTIQGATNLTFSAVDLATPGLSLRSLGVGDINIDGKLDLVSVHNNGQFVVLFGVGNGTFSAPELSASFGFALFIIAMEDLNLDGVVDVITQGNAPLYHRNTTLFAATTPAFANPTGIPFVVAADFNNDQKIDIFGSSNNVRTIGLNTTSPAGGAPTFSNTNLSQITTGNGAVPIHFAIGTPDAFPDLVSPSNTSVIVAKNQMAQGTVGFTERSISLGTRSVQQIATARLDGDNKSDIVAIRLTGSSPSSPPFTLVTMIAE